METLEIILILLTIGGLFITGIIVTKFSGKKQKKVIKTVKEENTEAITTSYQNTINVLSER